MLKTGPRLWLIEIVVVTAHGVCRIATALLTVTARIVLAPWLITTVEGWPKCGTTRSKIIDSDMAVSL